MVAFIVKLQQVYDWEKQDIKYFLTIFRCHTRVPIFRTFSRPSQFKKLEERIVKYFDDKPQMNIKQAGIGQPTKGRRKIDWFIVWHDSARRQIQY